MGFVENLLSSALARRLGQHAAAADAAMQYAHDNPSPGSVAGSFKDVVLGTLLGLPLEGAKNIGAGIGGAALVGGAAIDRATGYPSEQRRQTDEAILGAGLMHPLAAMEAAQHGPDSGVAHLAGALEMGANPLNYVGGVGEAGAALELAGKAPALAAALKNTALVGEAINRAQLLPLAAIPAARRALLSVPAFMREGSAATAAATQAAPAVDVLVHGVADQQSAREQVAANIASAARQQAKAVPIRLPESGASMPVTPPDALQLQHLPKIDDSPAVLSAIDDAAGVADRATPFVGDGHAPIPGGIAGDAPAALSDLDRMDALRGGESATNIADLLTTHYGRERLAKGASDAGPGRALRYLTGGQYDKATRRIVGGIGALDDQGRAILDGQDVTRPLLAYLLERGPGLTPEHEATLKAAIRGTDRAVTDAPGVLDRIAGPVGLVAARRGRPSAGRSAGRRRARGSARPRTSTTAWAARSSGRARAHSPEGASVAPRRNSPKRRSNSGRSSPARRRTP